MDKYLIFGYDQYYPARGTDAIRNTAENLEQVHMCLKVLAEGEIQVKHLDGTWHDYENVEVYNIETRQTAVFMMDEGTAMNYNEKENPTHLLTPTMRDWVKKLSPYFEAK